ncbi:MAG TPA: hypothetical protein PKO17_04995 [Pseudomonadales bacterium]|jgi:hypothetical protein|nr:hypothetical protein [Pseudomonadales bacterium]HMZ92431.1 hypothetical protein [Pseudomonadales bacterium]HNB83308.1 hypothetical protein [Pseudomonadales bacterium]HNF74844.1 hypothetical protein [Pseudomonadales bacterium]HNL23417.1 hypothetical protein [Pseudomonadales bacterium]
MKKLLLGTLFNLALIGSHAAYANVVDFDDLETATYGSRTVISPYHGFIWGEINNPALIAINDAHWTGTGNYNNSPGAPSAPNGALNAGIVQVVRANGGSFDFTGAYFAPFTSGNDIDSQGSTALELFVEGYRNGILTGTVSTTFTTAGYRWLSANLNGVTSLKIYGTNPAIQPYQTRWAMDDFTYQAAAVVPLPAPFWLMAASLVGLVGFVRTPAEQRG